MEEKVNYQELYRLQDIALDAVFSLGNAFYLTGGTALHRFYYNLRYSNDLDFFASNDRLFTENVNEILDSFEKSNYPYKRILHSRDFQRILFYGTLQLDFVNDYVHREGKSKISGIYRIDNVINILANKLGAIVNRDEEKDIFDLFSIATQESFLWSDILTVASKKNHLQRESLIERIKTFPLQWLNNIQYVKDFTINSDMVNALCDDIYHNSENTLNLRLF